MGDHGDHRTTKRFLDLLNIHKISFKEFRDPLVILVILTKEMDGWNEILHSRWVLHHFIKGGEYDTFHI